MALTFLPRSTKHNDEVEWEGGGEAVALVVLAIARRPWTQRDRGWRGRARPRRRGGLREQGEIAGGAPQPACKQR
jgi:hypothetical protein